MFCHEMQHSEASPWARNYCNFDKLLLSERTLLVLYDVTKATGAHT